jgi:hypothetical protein
VFDKKTRVLHSHNLSLDHPLRVCVQMGTSKGSNQAFAATNYSTGSEFSLELKCMRNIVHISTRTYVILNSIAIAFN